MAPCASSAPSPTPSCAITARWARSCASIGAAGPILRSSWRRAARCRGWRRFWPAQPRREAFAARFPFPVTESLQPILEDRSVTVAAVLTPPNTHLEIVSQLARAGKHILLEKPLDISTARAEQMVKACRDAGVTLGIVL